MPEIDLPQAPPLLSTKKPSRRPHLTVSAGLPHVAPARVLASAVIAATAAAVLIPTTLVGIGVALTGVAVLSAVFVGSPDRPSRPQVIAATSIAALLAVAGWRSAEWLSLTCIVVSLIATGVLVVGARSIREMAFTMVAPIVLAFGAAGWIYRGAASARSNRPVENVGAVIKVGLLTIALFTVFVALFAGADAAFASLVDSVVPHFGNADVGSNVIAGLAVGVFTALGCYIRFARPAITDGHPKTSSDTWMWAVPTGTVLALYAAFLITQTRAMFGGDAYVQQTAGLTYADYARSGFWQLFAVTALTILVVSIGWQRADRSTMSRRVLVRAILGGLCLAALAVVVSALHRMSLYMDTFGATRLRVSVMATELWLGAILLALIVAGVGLRTRQLPRAIGLLTIAATLSFAAYNPDSRIAQANVDRFEKTGKIDTYYLADLSADATGALLELPADLRACVLRKIARDVRSDNGWTEFNIGRSKAKRQLSGERFALSDDFSSCRPR
ncbi:DUF4173 domain-containing protein [Williamsia sp. 1135]|uniref:DUF4153 domain-containing protein n=1 Tax=Williamsia sp. 1135 TaxID=1889262 RepID=UPI000A108519|nr:DUF4173 domain-containing protein [Williamsia sp. 1135]ORM25014.1 hypothetical protein BFL43_24965 [Williamsia sp. 1135]